LRTLLPLSLSGSVAGIALGLLLGLDFSLLGDRFFRFAGDTRGFGRCSFFRNTLLLGLLGFARGLFLCALGRERLALSTTCRHRRIIQPGLRLEFVQKIFARFLRRLLPV